MCKVPPAHYKTFDSHFAKRKTKQMFKTYFSAQTFVTVLLALIAFIVIYQLFSDMVFSLVRQCERLLVHIALG